MRRLCTFPMSLFSLLFRFRKQSYRSPRLLELQEFLCHNFLSNCSWINAKAECLELFSLGEIPTTRVNFERSFPLVQCFVFCAYFSFSVSAALPYISPGEMGYDGSLNALLVALLR